MGTIVVPMGLVGGGGIESWDKVAKYSGISVSEDGLTFICNSTSGTWVMGRSATPLPSTGKWYMEYTMHAAVGTRHFLGVGVKDAIPLFTGVPGDIGWLWYNEGPTAWEYRVWKLWGVMRGAPNILRFAVDTSENKVWIGGSFAWMNSTGWDVNDPATGCPAMFENLSGTLYVWYSVLNVTATATGNFGATQFTYPIPAGFKRMNGG